MDEHIKMVQTVPVDDLNYMVTCKIIVRKIREEVAEHGTIRDSYLMALLEIAEKSEKAAD